MPTFTSPVSVASFQTYLKDGSTDPTLLAFFASLLAMATERVYDWLDRDYTANALKTDVFYGNGTAYHATRYPAGTLLAWSYVLPDGTIVSPGVSHLVIHANGTLVESTEDLFDASAEHTLSYQQPSTLTCPETVQQVIVEIAAGAFAESNQGLGSLGLWSSTSRASTNLERERFLDLTERHERMLRPYKRYPV